MNLNEVWYLLVGVLFTGYAILDGFDLGVGVLSLFSRNEEERRLHLNEVCDLAVEPKHVFARVHDVDGALHDLELGR